MSAVLKCTCVNRMCGVPRAGLLGVYVDEPPAPFFPETLCVLISPYCVYLVSSSDSSEDPKFDRHLGGRRFASHKERCGEATVAPGSCSGREEGSSENPTSASSLSPPPDEAPEEPLESE